MTIIRIILIACGVMLAGLIVEAIQYGNFWRAANWLTTDVWGMTTLFDLYLGLALSAIVIAYFERGAAALFWIIPLPFLGNVWTVIWFIYRLPELARRLKSTG